MRTRVVCGVSQGDPPLTIDWLKDGRRIDPVLGVNLSHPEPYASLLTISRVTATHTGEYSCIARNAASEVRYTAKLQVKGKTFHWILLPCVPITFFFLKEKKEKNHKKKKDISYSLEMFVARKTTICDVFDFRFIIYTFFGTWICIRPR